MKECTVLITGGGQGVGQAIAFRFAQEGANIVVLSKDNPIQIQETREGITKAGGQFLFCDTDIRDHGAIQKAVNETIAQFSSIDILINNTSAPIFSDFLHTTAEQFDLAISTSVRAAFFLSQASFPYLKMSKNPHIINIAPPLNLEDQWLRDYLPFSLGKYGMSLCTRGLAAEFQSLGISVNSLWFQTPIATQRLKNHLSSQVFAGSRWPAIVADATYVLVSKIERKATGQFFIDEDLLREAGVTDFSKYAVDPTHPLSQDIFLPLKEGSIPLAKSAFITNKESG